MEKVAETCPMSPGNKRPRDSTGSGSKPNPNKKIRAERKERSLYLLLITKGGDKYEHLNKDEFTELKKKMVETIFKTDGGNPLIDWFQHVIGRALCACTDSDAVKWVKRFVKKASPDYGAWLPTEGPNARPLRFIVPPPTSDMNVDVILAKMKETNKLPGRYLILFTKWTKYGRIIRFAADKTLYEALQEKKFAVHVGVDKLTLTDDRTPV